MSSATIHLRQPVPRHASAFTLVELLVVIGIIAIMIGILLPTLGRARASARSITCQANLRTIGQGIQIYALANKGVLPYGYWDGNTYDAFGRLLPLPAGTSPADFAGNWAMLVQNAFSGKYGTSWNSAFSSNANAARIREAFMCPDAPGTYDKNNYWSAIVHYYSHPRLMPQINYSTGIASERLSRPYKLGKIKRSAEVALVFDGALAYDPSRMVWICAGPSAPVANQIDNNGLFSAPFLLDTYANTTKTADESVNMTWKTGMTPNTDDGSSTAGHANIRFRHMNNTVMNALLCDGHVESFTYNKNKPVDDKQVTSLKRRNVYVNVAPK